MPIESERKYLEADLEETASLLEKAGAVRGGRHFETNIVYDTANLELFRSNRLLRLRKREWAAKSDILLTLKTPVHGPESNGVKLRNEFETCVQNWEGIAGILENLGYNEMARYEKARESWKLELDNGCVRLDLDELPFIKVVEIEGEVKNIDKAAALLGLDKFKISIKSYYELHQDWLKAENLPFTRSFTFNQLEKSALRKLIGLEGSSES